MKTSVRRRAAGIGSILLVLSGVLSACDSEGVACVGKPREEDALSHYLLTVNVARLEAHYQETGSLTESEWKLYWTAFNALKAIPIMAEGDTSYDRDGERLVCRNGVWQRAGYEWSSPTYAPPTSAAPTTTGYTPPSTSYVPPTTSATTTTAPPTTVPPTTTTVPAGPAVTLTASGSNRSSAPYVFNGSFVASDLDDCDATVFDTTSGLLPGGVTGIAFICQTNADQFATFRLLLLDATGTSDLTDYNGEDTGFELSSFQATVTQGASSEPFAGSVAGDWWDWSWVLPYDLDDGPIEVGIIETDSLGTPIQAT